MVSSPVQIRQTERHTWLTFQERSEYAIKTVSYRNQILLQQTRLVNGNVRSNFCWPNCRDIDIIRARMCDRG
jgi:hypothetical protein